MYIIILHTASRSLDDSVIEWQSWRISAKKLVNPWRISAKKLVNPWRISTKKLVNPWRPFRPYAMHPERGGVRGRYV